MSEIRMVNVVAAGVGVVLAYGALGLIFPYPAAHPVSPSAKVEEKVVIADRKQPSDDLATAVRSQILSVSEVKLLLERYDVGGVRSFFIELGPEFWTQNPNAPLLMREAGRVFQRAGGVAITCSDLIGFISALELPSDVRTRLAGPLLSSYLESKKPSVEELQRELAGVNVEDGLLVLGEYAAIYDLALPEAFAKLVDLAKRVGWQVNQKFQDRLLELLTHRGAFAMSSKEDAVRMIQFISQQSKPRAGLAAILGRVAMTSNSDAAALIGALIQNGRKDIGDILLESGIQPRQLADVVRSVPSAEREHILTKYANALKLQGSAAVLDFTQAFAVADLPPQAVNKIATAVFDVHPHMLNLWLTGVEKEERARILVVASKNAERALAPEAAKLIFDSQLASASPNAEELLKVLGHLPSKELESVPQRLQQLPEKIRDQALQIYYRTRVAQSLEEDPESIVALGGAMPASIAAELLPRAAVELAYINVESGLKLVSELTDPQIKASATREILSSDRIDIPVADRERLCFEQLTNSGEQADKLVPAFVQLVSEHFNSDVGKAKGVISKIPEGPLKQQVTAAFAKEWARYNPAGASEWIAELPVGKARDYAVKELVAAAKDQPDAAIQNIPAIGDSELRIATAIELLSAWRTIDPEYARSLLKTSALSDTDKNNIAGRMRFDE